MAPHMPLDRTMNRLTDRQKIERLRAELYLLLEQQRQKIIFLTVEEITNIETALEATI